jgi:hypothetical protein
MVLGLRRPLLDDREGRELEDGADPVLVLGLAADLNVPGVAPRGAPAVLDEEVRRLRVEVGPVPHRQNSVVDRPGLAARAVGKDPGLVELEDELAPLDGDRDGLHGKGAEERLLLSRRNINEGVDDRSRDILESRKKWGSEPVHDTSGLQFTLETSSYRAVGAAGLRLPRLVGVFLLL